MELPGAPSPIPVALSPDLVLLAECIKGDMLLETKELKKFIEELFGADTTTPLPPRKSRYRPRAPMSPSPRLLPLSFSPCPATPCPPSPMSPGMTGNRVAAVHFTSSGNSNRSRDKSPASSGMHVERTTPPKCVTPPRCVPPPLVFDISQVSSGHLQVSEQPILAGPTLPSGQLEQSKVSQKSQSSLKSADSAHITTSGSDVKKARQRPKHAISSISDDSTNSRLQKVWGHLAFARTSPRRRRPSTRHKAQEALGRLTAHWAYECVSAVVICFNALVVAIETQHRSQLALEYTRGAEGLREDVHWIVLRDLFCWFFVLDLAMRIGAQGWNFFFAADRDWNCFDCVVVVTAIADSLIGHLSQLPGGIESLVAQTSLLRIMRLLRIVRVTRFLRAMLIFRELRIMIYSLLGALKSLVWCIVVLFGILLIFGIFFTEGAILHMMQAEDEGQPRTSTTELRQSFGTLLDTMLSLLMAVTGGDDWANILRPLQALPLLYPMFFMIYIIFAIFALLNTITAVFVDSTVQRSQNDREFIVQTEEYAKKEFIKSMMDIFVELDVDFSGEISLDEMRAFMENPKIHAYFAALDVSVTQVKQLFMLIDVDNSGKIDQNEFIWGCLRLKGDAKSFDVALIQYEIKQMHELLMDVWSDHLGGVSVAGSVAGSVSIEDGATGEVDVCDVAKAAGAEPLELDE